MTDGPPNNCELVGSVPVPVERVEPEPPELHALERTTKGKANNGRHRIAAA
jgi:hypothetical protein